jgi:hypothetical protein
MMRVAKPVVVLLMICALGMKPSPPASAAGGDCLYECEGSMCADFGNKTQLCQETRAKCQARCSGKRWWGAIAYSVPDQQSGWSYEYSDVNAAKKQAMNRCIAAKGRACQVWAYFENECGALAADGKTVTWGTASLRPDAEKRALLECRKAGGRSCAIQAWVCSKM